MRQERDLLGVRVRIRVRASVTVRARVRVQSSESILAYCTTANRLRLGLG